MKIYKYIYFLVLIFSSCTHRSDLIHTLTRKEHADLQNLLNYLLFENQGVFVLFGSKPISEVILHPRKTEEEEKKLFASLPEFLKTQIKITHAPYDPYECWKTWKRKKDRYQIHDFLLVERNIENDFNSLSILIINVKSVLRIFNKHYAYFKNLFGQDFDPIVEIHEIKFSISAFWHCIFSDHIAKGLLFGYGEKNAESFAKMMQKDKKIENFDFSNSENLEPFVASKRKFSIPQFRSFKDEQIIQIYQREKEKIEEIYRNQDVVEITLKKLTGIL